MKNSSAISLLTSLLVISFCLSSCDKDHDIKKRDFEAKFKTWYRVSPLAKPVPIEVNGTSFAGFAHFPGGGTGHNSLLGKSSTYFNQLVYGNAPDAPPAGSVSAAVKDVPGYFVTGAPLPLIQAGDFNELASAISSLKIPASVYDNIVNQVFYNHKGEAIFTSSITGSGGTFPISQTVVGFNGKGIITGGRGKYKHAVGEFEYSGYFNVTNANDAEYNMKGWIGY
jgi:hypothetical protein